MTATFSGLFDDNKVHKWRHAYVDYDRLYDQHIKKAQRLSRSYEVLRKKRPDLVVELELDGDDGDGAGSASTSAKTEAEVEALLTKKSKGSAAMRDGIRYGATGDAGDTSREQSKQQLAQLKKELGDIVEQFKAALIAERQKAEKFYFSEVKMLKDRFELLIETVNTNYELQPVTSGANKRRRRTPNKLVRSTRALIASEALSALVVDGEDDIIEHSITVKNLVNERESVKRACLDLHRQTMLLYNFFNINFTAIATLVKRFNAAVPRLHMSVYDIIPKEYRGQQALNLGERVVLNYAKWFCDDDMRQANAQLMSKKGDSLEMDWSQLRLGYRLGICFTLMIWLCFDCVWNLYTDDQVTVGGRSAFPVFRACGGLLLWHWCWGASVYVWRRYRINYIYLFDFDPKVVLDPANIFNTCVDESLVFLFTLLFYYKTSTHTMPEPHLIVPGIYPAFLVAYTSWRLIFPLKQRRPLWNAIVKVWTAPLSSPSFFHTYVADVFTSMVKIGLDLLWTFCFIFSGDFLIADTVDTGDDRHSWQSTVWYKRWLVPLICLFPLYVRLMQCLRKFTDTGERVPNLPNAFKYTMSQVVTLFGAFFPVLNLHCKNDGKCGHMNTFQISWLAIFIVSSLYSWIWDVKMDWGLGVKKYAWLGPRLMFPSTVHYYGVMGADLVLRFMWMQSLIPPSGAQIALPSYLTAINMGLELIRRTLWSFFRLENEHRKSTLHYGESLNFVPFHFTTGHDHKYKAAKDRSGKRVLLEVVSIAVAVLVVCMLVVAAALRAEAHQQQEL